MNNVSLAQFVLKIQYFEWYRGTRQQEILCSRRCLLMTIIFTKKTFTTCNVNEFIRLSDQPNDELIELQ